MKTELDLLSEALARLERQHTTRNNELEARLNDLAGQWERSALRLHALSTQLSALAVQLERFERALPKR
jgi:hypothetical protein